LEGRKRCKLRKKIGTRTSAFGSPGRINHDSTPFYNSKLYEEFRTVEKIEYVENPLPPEFLDKIFNKSFEKTEEQNDNSVYLVVTSPPYNVGKEYDDKENTRCSPSLSP
jgi:site-specific DNA-methyltransferase (adenine-specific)